MRRGLGVVVAVLVGGAVARAEVVVPVDGEIVRGPAAVDPAKGVVRIGEAERPLGEFLLIESDDGALLWAPDFAARIAGYRRLVADRRGGALAALVKAAVVARDHVAARRILEWAKREGLPADDARKLGRRVAKLEAKPKKIREAKAAAVKAEEAVLRAQLPDLLLRRAERAFGRDGDELAGFALLREALRAAPGHAAARKALAARAPASHPAGPARAWLDWRIDFEARGYRYAGEGDHEYMRAKHQWRPDLYGIVGRDILLLTPATDKALVQRTLRRTGLAFGVLAELFATDDPVKRSPAPLRIDLHGHKQNFHERAGFKDEWPFAPYFQWRLARFSVRANATRLLVPQKAGDDAYYDRASLHECVRHWLWSKNPRYATAKIMRAQDVAGYWVAVGVPMLLAEAHYDLARDRVTFPKTAPSLVFARTRAQDLLPWNEFLLMNAADANQRLEKMGRLPDGTHHEEVFRAQAAALAHYLYVANEGAHRTKLADYLVFQKQGRSAELVPQKIFGKPAQPLGIAVLRHLTVR